MENIHLSSKPNFAADFMKTCFLFLVISLAFSVSAQTVEIPDPVSEGVIRRALGKSEGDITAADIESLTELDASRETTHSPITSFEGIEAATNLSSLNLQGDWFSFFSSTVIAAADHLPLGRLSGLTTLNLSGNDLTDVSFLEGMTSLTALDLSHNDLTDFSFLKSLYENCSSRREEIRKPKTGWHESDERSGDGSSPASPVTLGTGRSHTVH